MVGRSEAVKRVAGVLAACVMSVGCDRVERAIDVLLEDPSQTPPPTEVADGETTAPIAVQPEPQVQKQGAIPFQVYDKGLNVVRTTVLLPAGWRGYQDIATSPRTGQAEQYVLDYYGPNGELIRGTGATNYYGPLNQRFARMWPKLVEQAMNGVGEDVKLGERRETEMVERLPNINKVLGNINKEAFEVPFTAQREGKPLEGVAYVLHIPFSNDSGTFLANIVVASPEHIEAAIDVGWKIGASEQINPEYTRIQNEISRKAMARSQREHQARMQANQRSFNAHQARMKGQQAAFDQANARWMDNFRGGGGSGGNGYTGHDAFIDSIHETDTFHDPSTGQNVRRSGQFKYNYTDGQGNFYGTNDPSFSPAALQGNWQATQPLQP